MKIMTNKFSNSIVITSIYLPTQAICKFATLKKYQLIVVGDKKTPLNWTCQNAIYIPIKQQTEMNYRIGKYLPYNHYSRKMVGYLYAIKNNARIIIDADDDNIPYSFWEFPKAYGIYNMTNSGDRFLNIYSLFTKDKIWPRGLPLNKIGNLIDQKTIIKKKCKVGIWQGLANGDPDVDAIYRLSINKSCYFQKNAPIVLKKGNIAPINSQNTLFTKKFFPLLYLPTSVTFRFTDILRGYVAQPILWAAGYNIGFTDATVLQIRNEHDYMTDFRSEIPMYINSENIINFVESSVSCSKSIEENLYTAYKKLMQNNIVTKMEMKILESWLRDIEYAVHLVT